MISLNIEKTFGFISKASVAAYEAQVQKRWKTVPEKVMTSLAGCTSLILGQNNFGRPESYCTSFAQQL